MSGWERTHRRYRLVYAVADDLVRRGRSALPDWRATIEAEYGDLATFHLDVRRRWMTAVEARLDDESRSLTEIQSDVADANRPLWLLLGTLDETVTAESAQWPQPAQPQPAQ